MYNEYFGFKEAPFSIAPDPRYLYMTAQHRDALAHLVYGLNSEGGCILLTGEVGTGKTTICRCLLEQIPEQANVALLLNPKVNEIELLETICDELKISYPDSNSSVKTYTDRIYDFLIRSNQRNEKTVLIIDEAQNLDSRVLEQLRLLTNLETDQRKLLQIIILGQPELLDILSQSEMRQLAQRITARFHLKPLTPNEVKAYISHRLAIAGQHVQLFPENSIKLVYKLSKGVPRLINVICDRALLGAYVENQYTVAPSIVKKAAREVFGELKNVAHHKKSKKHRFLKEAVIGGLIFALSALFAYLYLTNNNNGQDIQTTENESDSHPPALTNNIAIEETAPEKESLESTVNTGMEAVLIETDETAQSASSNHEEATDHPASQTETSPVTSTTESKDKTYDDIKTVVASADNSPASAYQALFSTWKLKYNRKTSTTACKQAEKHALSCLFKHGNLSSLKIHNRPAVLTLNDRQGNKRYITITAINKELATVVSSNQTYTVRLNELNQYWYGQFALLWNKPEHYSAAITPGKTGNIIKWLHTQLTKLDNIQAGNAPTRYDESLVNRVKAFQAEQGLAADGIVGPLTIIRINTHTGTKVPALVNPDTASKQI